MTHVIGPRATDKAGDESKCPNAWAGCINEWNIYVFGNDIEKGVKFVKDANEKLQAETRDCSFRDLFEVLVEVSPEVHIPSRFQRFSRENPEKAFELLLAYGAYRRAVENRAPWLKDRIYKRLQMLHKEEYYDKSPSDNIERCGIFRHWHPPHTTK